MSKRDELDRFDGDWSTFLAGRQGTSALIYSSSFNNYRYELQLEQVPHRVRTRFIEELNAQLMVRLTELQVEERAKLLTEVVAEARETLAEFGALPRMPGAALVIELKCDGCGEPLFPPVLDAVVTSLPLAIGHGDKNYHERCAPAEALQSLRSEVRVLRVVKGDADEENRLP